MGEINGRHFCKFQSSLLILSYFFSFSALPLAFTIKNSNFLPFLFLSECESLFCWLFSRLRTETIAFYSPEGFADGDSWKKMLSFLQSYLRGKLVLRRWRRQWVRKFLSLKDFTFAPWSHGNETNSKLKITWMKLLTQSSHESRVWTSELNVAFESFNAAVMWKIQLWLLTWHNFHIQRKFDKNSTE